MNLKIGGQDVLVKLVPNLCSDEGALGRFNTRSYDVEIDESLSGATKEATLLHEIIEAINKLCELDLEHNVICTLETMLYQVLSDNLILFDGTFFKEEEENENHCNIA